MIVRNQKPPHSLHAFLEYSRQTARDSLWKEEKLKVFFQICSFNFDDSRGVLLKFSDSFVFPYWVMRIN